MFNRNFIINMEKRYTVKSEALLRLNRVFESLFKIV